MNHMLRILQLSLSRRQHISQFCVFLLQSGPLVVLLVSHSLFMLLRLLPRFRPLQKVFDSELVFLGESSDEFYDFAVADEQLKQQLKQQLQLVEVAVLHQPKQGLLPRTRWGKAQRLKCLRHHLYHCTEVVQPQLEISLRGRVSLLHHRRQTQRLRVRGQLRYVGDASFFMQYVASRQAWKSSGLKRS